MNNKIKTLTDYMYITLGAFIASMGVNAFLVPNKIVTGGLTGLTTVIYYLLNEKLPVGTLMLIINLPLFLLSLKLINSRALFRSIYGMFTFSIAIDVTKSFVLAAANAYLYVYQNTHTDVLLFSLFGGALLGTGIGIIIRYGGSTGGTVLLARIIVHLHPKIDLSKLLLLFDALIIGMAAVTFKNILFSLYGIITVVIITRVVDMFLETTSNARAVFIISQYPEDVKKCILQDLDCGLTVLYGKGAYGGEEKQVLMCVFYKNIYKKLYDSVNSIDPKAFIVKTDVREVLGKGFTLVR